MAPRIFAPDEDLSDVDAELQHTILYVTASPLTQALAAPLVALRQELRGVAETEDQLRSTVSLKRAEGYFVDDELNALVEETKVAVLAHVGQRYDAPLYRQLFGDQSPSEVARPLLGDQLTTMRAWVGPLGAVSNMTLNDISVRLKAVVERADAIVAAQALAQTELDNFMEGPRKAFIDKCNAARQLAAGKLGEIVHSNKHLKLPSDFADRFFLAGSSNRAPSRKDVERTIDRLKAKLARQEGVLQQMNEKETRAERVRREAAIADRETKLAAAEKKAAEAARELAALKAEMDAPAAEKAETTPPGGGGKVDG